jgi:hypothetical protein
MTSREFCYWLQGHFELNNGDELTPHQVQLIKKHLNLVFHHEIDPSYPDSAKLNQIHNDSNHLDDSPNVLVRC